MSQFFYFIDLLVKSLSIKRFGSVFSVKLTLEKKFAQFCDTEFVYCLRLKLPLNEVMIFVWGGRGREGWGEGEITRKPDFYVQRYNQVNKLKDCKEAENQQAAHLNQVQPEENTHTHFFVTTQK